MNAETLQKYGIGGIMEISMRKRVWNITYAVIMCAVLALCLGGCSYVSRPVSADPDTADDGYRVYYTNPERTALVRRDYEPKSEDFEGILSELLDAFSTPETTDVRSALPEQITFTTSVIGVNEIDVDFNAEYLSLDTVTELLLRSALVKTLLCIKGVDSVRFTVESQNLVLGDEEIGIMNDDTFIVPAGNGINSYRNAQLTLYFPSGDGTVMSRESRTVHYSSNVNIERLVIENMLEGPRNESLLPVAVADTLIQDVSVSNGFCIVDFSKEINSAPAGEVIANPETVLYAFTNALIDSCTDDRITGVRFRIEGSTDLRFRDQVNLDQIFSRNAELISSSLK